MAGRDAEELGGAWRGCANERFELAVEVGDLVVECADAAGDRSQRELGGLAGRGELVERWPEAAAERGFAAQRLATFEQVAEFLRGGDDQPAELEDRCGAGLDRALARVAQQPDRFDDPIAVLGDRGRLPGEQQPGGELGVDRVALAAATARVLVRLVDLEHLDVVFAQVAHEAGGV